MLGIIFKKNDCLGSLGKKRMRKLTIGLIVGIVLVVALIITSFVYYATAQNTQKTEINNPINGIGMNKSEIIVDEDQVAYVLNEIGAWKLHNPPLSSNRPKVEVIVNTNTFRAEVSNGKIAVEKGNWDSPDIRIRTSGSEIVDAITSANIKDYIKQSVSSGKTRLELVAGYAQLFSKGYLNLYQDITGKSFTGSVVRIFGQV
jgi:hypothetical protein